MSASLSECCCSFPSKIKLIEFAIVPIFAKPSTKFIVSSKGPAIPKDRIITDINTSALKLPLI